MEVLSEAQSLQICP